MMQISCLFLALLALPSSSFSQNPASDPYVPHQLECTDAVTVRAASKGLSVSESAWRKDRLSQVVQSLHTYLPRANLTGFNVTKYLSKVAVNNAPIVGMAISGGGTQSGLGGLGMWQAFDERYAPAVAAGTGGLAQCLTYLTGLSGGGLLTVGSLASNNFSTVADLREAVNFTTNYLTGPTGNTTEYYTEFFENAGAKAELGYPVSVADIFGQMMGQYLPRAWRYKSFSDIASANHSFTTGVGPMPIITFAEIIPGLSPNIGGIMYPGPNATNSAELSSYEINPFEFGSWLGGRVQAFFPIKWLGTPMRKGNPQNKTQCVQGFDKFTLVQGSTGNAFNFWFIDAWYNIPLFYKRSVDTLLNKRQNSTNSSGNIQIPPDQADNLEVQLVNETATNFGQSFSDTLWATYPNPFQGYNSKMAGVEELLLVDGSETGETVPIRPLIIPERKVDFIIAFDSGGDGVFSWVNGTNLIDDLLTCGYCPDSARSASELSLPFPKIPSSTTMQNLNLTTYPTFFGCNATSGPLVLYVPQSPWTGYMNYSYQQSSFTDNQFDQVMQNTFNIATYGNGSATVGEMGQNWPACLACGVIQRSLARVNMQVPDICRTCFTMHCWNGEVDETAVSKTMQNKVPILDPGLTYEEWNQTWWGA